MDKINRIQNIVNHIYPHQEDSTVEAGIGSSAVCGIMCYVGNGSAFPFLIEGLKILENRGYDSAGVCTIDKNNKHLHTTKYASSPQKADAIDRLGQEGSVHGDHTIGIAHTRWATHGGKTDPNAHPHHDHRDRIAVIHNGVIENAFEIKKHLEQKGIVFRSETDTEVIAQLIGEHVNEGLDTLEAVKKTVSQLHGTWGLAVLDSHFPDQIIAAKNGSPILIGIGQGRMFVASEPVAFARYTKEYISLEDGEVALIKPDSHSLDVSRIELAPDEKFDVSPSPYDHWTIKEIMEQPTAVSASLNHGGRIMGDGKVKLGGLEQNIESLKNVKHLVIAACGTSLHAALYAGYLMRSLGSFETVQEIDAAEMQRELVPPRESGLLVISQSGETKDVHRALSIGLEMGIPCFSVVNIVRSLIARTTRCGVYLNAGREFGVASTKAFTCQATVLSLIAVWFSTLHDPSKENKRKQVIDALHRLPTNIGMCIARVRGVCKEVAKSLLNADHCFVLGKGLSFPIAREGALKIKEITYLHAEGYSGGALKHGPFALIVDKTPVIMIILDDVHENMMETALQEVKARGAFTIIITNKSVCNGDVHIQIPSNGVLTSLLAVIPLQLIAYELCLLRGYDPDRPRNLAKAVTTD